MAPLTMFAAPMVLFASYGILPRSGGWDDQEARWAKIALTALAAMRRKVKDGDA